MVEFSTPAWIVLGAVAGIGVLAILNSAATIVRNQTYVHDTKVKVNILRKDYVDRVKDAPDPEDVDHDGVLLVDEAKGSSSPTAPTKPAHKSKPRRV